MPGVDPHVPRILWIEYEENWDDWLVRDGLGAHHKCLFCVRRFHDFRRFVKGDPHANHRFGKP